METPAWGIDPVPDRLRVFRLTDHAILWASLGVSLLVLVISQFLVPALTFRDALLAILVGATIGCAMLGQTPEIAPGTGSSTRFGT